MIILVSYSVKCLFMSFAHSIGKIDASGTLYIMGVNFLSLNVLQISSSLRLAFSPFSLLCKNTNS